MFNFEETKQRLKIAAANINYDHIFDESFDDNNKLKLGEAGNDFLLDYAVRGFWSKDIPLDRFKEMCITEQNRNMKANNTDDNFLNSKFELIEILNQKALFSRERILTEAFPNSLFQYDLRDDGCGNLGAIENHVYVNYGGTIITSKKLYLGQDEYIELSDKNHPNFTGENISLEEYIQKYVPRDTNELMMLATHKLVKESGAYNKAENIIDYFLPKTYNIQPLTNYRFDFYATPNFGGSEGIYIDCYIKGVFDDTGINKTISCGTYKTLKDDLESMQIMGELAGTLTYYNKMYVNDNLHRYTPDKELEAQARYATNSNVVINESEQDNVQDEAEEESEMSM